MHAKKDNQRNTQLKILKRGLCSPSDLCVKEKENYLLGHTVKVTNRENRTLKELHEGGTVCGLWNVMEKKLN